MKKLLLLVLPLLIIITGCGGKAAETNNGQRFYSLLQGFEYIPSRQDPVGYITSLKIGGVEGAADITVPDPMDITAKLKVFGVVSWFTWREGANDPVVFAAQVSEANKENLTALGKTDLTDLKIDFSFVLYDYDVKTRAYYKVMSSGTETLQGTLYKQDKYPLFLMSTDSSAVVSSPKNFNFQLGVKGTGGQKIIIGEAGGEVSALPWGGE
jgi:hypothetical protein